MGNVLSEAVITFYFALTVSFTMRSGEKLFIFQSKGEISTKIFKNMIFPDEKKPLRIHKEVIFSVSGCEMFDLMGKKC